MSTSPAPTTRTKVLLVDDHDLIRKGLRHAFERDRQFEVVGEAAAAAEAVRQAGALQPDVVIMDLRLPDGSGLEATRALRKNNANMGIVVLTMYAGDDQLFGALEAGASAFVPKTAPADEVVAAADLVVLAVPDDTLEGLVAGLAETGMWRAGQLAFHTSGAHGLAVLAPAARVGVLPLALHPAMTFAGAPEDADRLAGAPFGVTSAPEHRPVAETLVLEMGGEPFFVAEADRRLYHAALVTGANHLVTLVAEAADLLRAAGIDDAARVLAPLLTAALDNGLRRGDRGLTGPVSRGDVGTVRDHLETMAERAPESVDAYVAMAQRTTERALAAGRLKRHEGAPLVELLDGHVPGSLASERAEG